MCPVAVFGTGSATTLARGGFQARPWLAVLSDGSRAGGIASTHHRVSPLQPYKLLDDSSNVNAVENELKTSSREACEMFIEALQVLMEGRRKYDYACIKANELSPAFYP
ncbi:uncharacterized protein [Dermacentor albipictus]|uniref:uncharacterized protein isoform X2 n=1 Tax=Dermacentor albipictus TaxID=60249 RepID=UPI0038FC899E